MTDLSQRFVDPTLPGRSAQDLGPQDLGPQDLGAQDFMAQASLALNAAARNLTAWRRELMIQRDLRDLDPVLLRDIGLDRSRS